MDAGDRTTTGLVDDLVRDLAPARRFPSLITALALVLGAWAVGAGLSAMLHGPPAVLLQRLTSDPLFGLVIAGLGFGALAGCAGAISSVLPGREDTTRRAGRASVLGLGLAIVIGIAANLSGVDPITTPLSKDAACFVSGAGLGFAPLVVIIVLERRGFIQKPAHSALIALAGAFGLGALAVQLFCQQPGARHALLGHLSVPVVLIVLATVPLARLLSRVRS